MAACGGFFLAIVHLIPASAARWSIMAPPSSCEDCGCRHRPRACGPMWGLKSASTQQEPAEDPTKVISSDSESEPKGPQTIRVSRWRSIGGPNVTLVVWMRVKGWISWESGKSLAATAPLAANAEAGTGGPGPQRRSDQIAETGGARRCVENTQHRRCDLCH